MGTVPQSAIDSRVRLWLGNITEVQLQSTILHMHREDVMAFHVAELDLSHQNHRTQKTTVNLQIWKRDYTMPTAFANPVLARIRFPQFGRRKCNWMPVDIVNFDMIPERENSNYMSCGFFGADNQMRLSWSPETIAEMEIYYQNLMLPDKLATSAIPIADVFAGMTTAEIAFRCLPAAKIPDSEKEQYKEVIVEALEEWKPIFSKLMNRAPNQSSPRRTAFGRGRFNFGPGSVGYYD